MFASNIYVNINVFEKSWGIFDKAKREGWRYDIQ